MRPTRSAIISLVLLASLMLQAPTQLWSQILGVPGEEELFNASRRYMTMSIECQLRMTQSTPSYADELFSMTEQELFQGGPAISLLVPFSKRLVLRTHVPYYMKIGMTPDGSNLPGLMAFRVNNSWGDISTDLTWTLLRLRSPALNLETQLGYIAPIGQSRFDRTYKGYLAIGNGFHALEANAGIGMNLSRVVSAFINGGVAHRFPRNFESTFGFIEHLEPDLIAHGKAGIGALVTLFGEQDLIGIVYERLSIGSIASTAGSVHGTVEPQSSVEKIGMSLEGIHLGHKTAYLYAGVERSSAIPEALVFVYSLDITFNFDVFRISL